MNVPACLICKDDGWVCENHPKQAYGDGTECCGSPGMHCICAGDSLRHVVHDLIEMFGTVDSRGNRPEAVELGQRAKRIIEDEKMRFDYSRDRR